MAAFGSIDGMKKAFNDAGMKVFGSGWVFLVIHPKTRVLKIHTAPNQDSVFLEEGMEALVANDCWEHAYYLKYQNKRIDYLTAFWNVVAGRWLRHDSKPFHPDHPLTVSPVAAPAFDKRTLRQRRLLLP